MLTDIAADHRIHRSLALTIAPNSSNAFQLSPRVAAKMKDGARRADIVTVDGTSPWCEEPKSIATACYVFIYSRKIAARGRERVNAWIHVLGRTGFEPVTKGLEDRDDD